LLVHTRTAVRLSLLACAFAALAASAAAAPLTPDERVATHRAVEQVLWAHRLWPADNSGPKPRLQDVLSDTALRERAGEALLRSRALDLLWGRPVAPDQLQAEMNRMAAESQQGLVLEELFAALGNDPRLIAETLARPALSERLLRDSYAMDERFHGALRQRAETELARMSTPEGLEAAGEPVVETTWTLRSSAGAAQISRVRAASEFALDAPEWNRRVRLLRGDAGVPLRGTGVPLDSKADPAAGADIPENAADLQPGWRTALQEDTVSFFVEFVVRASHDAITTTRVTWPKEPFDSWWALERARLSPAVEDAGARYTLPSVIAAGCTYDTWAPVAGDTIPDARANQTAVWTGTEMIIWGGAADGSGSRFNPATATWTPTGEGPNVPAARYYHVAVWTGTEMLVWGGTDGPFYFDTGARYNPSTNTWTAMSTAGAPSPRALVGQTAAWTGSELVVWGGESPGLLNDGGRYNPLTNSWTSMSPSPLTARRYHTTVWTGGEVIIWGGATSTGTTNTGARYDPVSNSWAMMTTTGAPIKRHLAPGVWTGTEFIVWSGFDGGALQNTGGKYTPGTDTWVATSTTGAPTGRVLATGVWTGTKAVFWGGQDATGAPVNTGGVYTPSPGAGSWTATSTGAGAPLGRQQHTVVFTGTEMIVFGGFGTAFQPSNTGGRYNPTSNTWIALPAGASVPAARYLHTMVWDGVEAIVWGGANGAALNTGSRYTPATNTWTATSTTSAPIPRLAHTAVWNGTQMIVWGGTSNGANTFNTGGRYNPTTNSWLASATAGAATARQQATAVWTGTLMLTFGGIDNGFNAVGVGGRYNPSTDSWTPMSPTASPVPRSGHSAVWNGSRMIVWGGSPDLGTTGLNSGGRYDPGANTWTATIVDANTPSARFDHAAVVTGTNMNVAGGMTAAGASASGSTYNSVSSSWGPLYPTVAGHAAQGPGAIATGTEVLVWSGYDGAGNYPNTGARYDIASNTWTPMSTTGAPRGMFLPTAVNTGTQMMVWGDGRTAGGLYCTVGAAAAAAGRVPDAGLVPGIPLKIAKAAGGQISLTWGASCRVSDTDYEVYEGSMGGAFNTHAPFLCTTGGMTSATILPTGGSRYYLVVPRSLNREGSYGVNSLGVQRAQGPSACFTQLTALCP